MSRHRARARRGLVEYGGGGTGCGVDLLAADELDLKELRQSRQKSITCWTRTETPPPAPKSSAKGWERIVREREFSPNFLLVSAFLTMGADMATRNPRTITAGFGAGAQQTRRLAVHASGLLMRWGSGGCELPAGVRPGRPMSQPPARVSARDGRRVGRRLTARLAFSGLRRVDIAFFTP